MEQGKSVEDQRDDYSLREEFIAVMAHEMKNTLSSIVSFSEILLSQKLGKLNDRQKVRLQHILDGGSRLNSMIIDIVLLVHIFSFQFLIVLILSFGNLAHQ